MHEVPLVVTIDGPAGSGKSTVARILAQRLGLSYLDTGALYRALAWFLKGRGIAAEETAELRQALHTVTVSLERECVSVCGQDVTSLIRSPEIDAVVSSYAALPSVRKRLLDVQRCQAVFPGVVADGRDMGTVVFPDASIKFFLVASPGIRARRRVVEMQARGEVISEAVVLECILKRDRFDSERREAPLRKPEGSVEIDTSEMSIDDVVSRLYDVVSMKGPE
jgi:cytidylate kinase